MRKLLCFCLLVCVPLAAQEVPVATELSGNPFFIKKTWLIGGVGSWDYLTMDPSAQRLYIAHGSSVQVVDVETGTIAGEISGFREAHAISLDDTGALGYISDGRANNVKVFDRRSLQIVATIPTVPNPRALVFEPQTKLLFAVCTVPPGTASASQVSCGSMQPAASRGPPQRANVVSSIAVIDTVTRAALGQILFPGKLGFAEADGNGKVYVNVTDRNQVLRLDAQAIAVLLQKQLAAHPSNPAVSPAPELSAIPAVDPSVNPSPRIEVFTPAVTLDWSRTRPPDEDVFTFPLPAGCRQPVSLAVDGAHMRMFAACDNWKIAVLNTGTGEPVASLTTGPGTDAIAYDQSRGLIFSANGGGYGSLTVIRQDATTDTYAVIQDLPTQERARTLAIDFSTGAVYLVTDFIGVDLAHQGGIGALKSGPINGSFQVLVIAH
jgi:DNA-binding beta-propeller fold protein YncE